MRLCMLHFPKWNIHKLYYIIKLMFSLFSVSPLHCAMLFRVWVYGSCYCFVIIVVIIVVIGIVVVVVVAFVVVVFLLLLRLPLSFIGFVYRFSSMVQTTNTTVGIIIFGFSSHSLSQCNLNIIDWDLNKNEQISIEIIFKWWKNY